MNDTSQEKPIMYQEWRNLLFLHWIYDAGKIQKMLPEGLIVDTYEGKAYITIVPFLIRHLSVLNFFSLPFFSNFIEVNVRTYVRDKNGIRGFWFFSLDINSNIFKTGARQFFFLPYYNAKLDKHVKDNELLIEGERQENPRVKMKFKYQFNSPFYNAEEGSLDFFLLERYFLFTFHAHQLYLQRIEHSSYPLSHCLLEEYESNLFEANALEAPANSPILMHHSSGVDVNFFPLKSSI